ncbi:hypothetical protein RB595_005078 [Gaeumannomyces hyphopodioides]
MRADNCVRYFICRDYDGFHTYGGGGAAATSPAAVRTLITRFLGTPLYALVWTFDPSTLTTLVLFLNRRGRTFPGFADTLRALGKHLAAGLSLPGFASSLFLAHDFDDATGRREGGALFAQLTHVDASASIKFARSSAQDSSSMKTIAAMTIAAMTIAAMTMAFLPATFFAALFSVPSLQWNGQDKVVQGSFWVYWAFTPPATALVFPVWLLANKRQWLARDPSRLLQGSAGERTEAREKMV